MDAKGRYQALQAHLRDARSRLDAGHPEKALEALEAALTLDPNCLAALLLRERISGISPQLSAISPQLSAVSPQLNDQPVSQPSTVDEGMSVFAGRFEERVRKRRIDGRAAAARASIASGDLAAARTALDEIKELDPGHHDVALFESQLAVGVRSAPTWSSRGARLTAAAAFLLVVLGIWSLDRRPMSVNQVDPPVTIQHTEPPALHPTLLESSGAPVIEPSIGTIREPIPEQVPIREPIRAQVPVASTPPPIPAALPRAAIRTESIDTPSRVASKPVDTPVSSPPGSSVPAVAPPPATAEPIRTESAIPASTSSTAIAESTHDNSVATVPPPAPAPTLPIETSFDDQNDRQIRDLLQRYRLAYEKLSAPAARQVWPGVNEAALARAFDGLETQALMFDDCQVLVRGTLATVTCRGTARYVPKIGSRYERVEPRNWAFKLRRRGPQWEIESAIARRD